MLVGQQPRASVHRDRTEEDARCRFFRCLANRCVPAMDRYVQAMSDVPVVPWYKPYLDTYLAVESDLVKRRLLPERQGVLWQNGRQRVLFAFKDLLCPVPGNTQVETLAGERNVSVPGKRGLSAQAWHVYRWQE